MPAAPGKPPRVLVYYRTDAHPPLTPEEVQELETFFGPPTFERLATITDDDTRHGQREVVEYAKAGAIDSVVTRRGVDLSPEGFKGYIEAVQRFHDAGLTIWVWKQRELSVDRNSKKLYPALVALQEMQTDYRSEVERKKQRKAQAEGKHVGRPKNCERPGCGHPPTRNGKDVHEGGTGPCKLCTSCPGYIYRGMAKARRTEVSTSKPPAAEPEEDDDEDDGPDSGARPEGPQADDDRMGSDETDPTDSGPV